MSMRHFVTVDDAGSLNFIHDDSLAEFSALGGVRIQRASHVEPNACGQWEADLSPVGGPVLGPFMLRREALAAERVWLEAHLFGGCEMRKSSG